MSATQQRAMWPNPRSRDL